MLGKYSVSAGCLISFALQGMIDQAFAQTVGPSPPTITTTTNVTSGLTTIVGSSVISTGASPAANVTGGALSVDSTAGPAPGVITIQTGNGNALQANGGTITVPNGGLGVQTGGGHAFLANGAASTINILNGATITSTGVGAALAAIGGTINATGVTMLGGASSSGHGAVAEAGGTIFLHGGVSITRGGGFNAVGLGASGVGSRVIADAIVPLTMQGRGAMGIYVHDGGLVSLLPGSTLQLNGTSSVGVAVDNTSVALGTLGSGLTVNLDGTHVAGQASSTGVVAFNNGAIAIQNLVVQGANAGAGAWAGAGSRITISGNSVININASSSPTYYTLATANLVTFNGPVGSIFSVTSTLPLGGFLAHQGGSITSTGTIVNVTSNNGVGAFAGQLGPTLSSIDLTSNVITTTGVNSIGLQADSNSQITGRDSRITTSGGGAALLVSTFNAPGSIDLTNSIVLADGPNTTGLFSRNLTPNLVNNVRLSGGSLVSNRSTAVAAQGPLDLAVTNGAVVTGGGGFLLQAFDSTFGPQPTVVNFNASNGSVLTGDGTAEALSTANINLTTGSQWTGAAYSLTNVTVDPTSIWNVTASSILTQQLTNAGLVAFTPPVGDAFKTVTATNYVGANGVLGLNTFLGTDGSPSDKLIINGGAATGSSALRVTNAGGPGDLTRGNGILVVDTINGGATNADAFTLARPVVAGPYNYTLHRSSVDGSNSQAWYLRSTIDCTIDPTNPACGGPGPGPTPEPAPDYRAEVSLYAAIPAAAMIYGRTLLDTLHERVGDRDPDAATRNDRAGWGRLIGFHGRQDGGDHGIYGLQGPAYSYDLFAFQAGLDLLRWDNADGSRDHLGGYFAIGTATTRVKHANGTDAGKDSLNGYTLGGYWTHYGAPGWYVDGVLQATWYGSVTGQPARPLGTLQTTGFGIAASGEAGYPIRLGSGYFIEPQGQLIYQSVKIGDASDMAALVQFRNAQSFIGRLGARLGRTWPIAADNPHIITTWVRLNVWNDFLGKPTTDFSSANGFIPFRADISGAWGEVNVGVDAKITKNAAIFANASYLAGFKGDRYGYDGKIGMRVTW